MASSLGVQLEALTELIIGAAFTVSNTLGHGFLEAVYRNALYEELSTRRVSVKKEKVFIIYYNGKQVGRYVADIVVHEKVIVELKAVDRLNQAHGAQVLNYLKAANLGVGLLFNFGVPKVEVRRIINRSYFDTAAGTVFGEG